MIQLQEFSLQLQHCSNSFPYFRDLHSRCYRGLCCHAMERLPHRQEEQGTFPHMAQKHHSQSHTGIQGLMVAHTTHSELWTLLLTSTRSFFSNTCFYFHTHTHAYVCMLLCIYNSLKYVLTRQTPWRSPRHRGLKG